MLKQKWREEGRSGVPRRDGVIKVLDQDKCYCVLFTTCLVDTPRRVHHMTD